MASTASLVVTSVASGGFAIAGAVVNNWMSGRRDERQLAAQTALAIADIEPLIWTIGGWIDLNVALQRQETRLAFAAVPEELISTLHRVTLACWHDYQDDSKLDEEGEEYHAISTQLLDARRALGRATAGYLIRKKRSARDSLKAEALESAQKIMAEWQEEHPNVRFG